MNLRDKYELPKIIIAGDTPFGNLEPILDGVRDAEHVVGVKVGALTVGADYTLRQVADGIHERNKLVIYDMQKMGKDVPFVVGQQAENFASVADLVITDPKTVEHWRKAHDAVEAAGKGLITVLYMTDESGTEMYRLGTAVDIAMDVRESGRKLDHVVLPANQLAVTEKFLYVLDRFDIHPVACGPGIGKDQQGGDSEDAGKRGVDVGIIGRYITGSEDKVGAANEQYNFLKKGVEARKVA